MTFSRRPETGDNQEQRDAFREQAARRRCHRATLPDSHGTAPPAAASDGRRGDQRHGPGDCLSRGGAAAERPIGCGGDPPASGA